MREICASASACHALLACQFLAPKPLQILSRNCAIERNPFCKLSRPRLRSSSSHLRMPIVRDSLVVKLVPQNRGSNRLLARATDEDGEGSVHEDGFDTSRPASILVKRIRIAVQIFVAALIYIFYFFGASAWDGKGKKK